jgi:hypothetical protein
MGLVLASAFPFLRLKATSIFFLFARVRGRLTITMKPHPKLRKTIKWGGAAVTVLLVVVWIGSGWVWVSWNPHPLTRSISDRQRHVSVAGGCICSSSFKAMAGVILPSGVDAGRMQRSFRWIPEYWGSYTSDRLVVPLWPACMISGLLTGAAWRLDTLAHRRAGGRLNLCPKCNYNRAGIAKDAVCPECGERPMIA